MGATLRNLGTSGGNFSVHVAHTHHPAHSKRAQSGSPTAVTILHYGRQYNAVVCVRSFEREHIGVDLQCSWVGFGNLLYG